MVRAQDPELPPFTFPVVAWGPKLAIGDASDAGIREFLAPRDVTTVHFPERDTRLGWTFVDAEGRCWEAVASRVIGRANAWGMLALPRWLTSPKYRLALDFAERPPMGFDAVKGRLFAAVAANPRHYRGYVKERREELRRAQSLQDLIKSDEERAIEHLRTPPLWWQWLFWEGRCARSSFLGVVAVILSVSLLGILWARIPPLALALVFVPSAPLWIAAVVRRLHDVGRTGLWIAAWAFFSYLCAEVYDSADAAAAKVIAASLWQIASICALAFLLLWPGTRGSNRYGLARPQK